MKMKTLIRKWIPGLLAAALLCAPVKAYAAGDPIVDNGNGVISIVYQDRNNDPIPGMRVRIYRVANVTGQTNGNAASGYDVNYQVMPDFRQFDESTGTTRITGF